VGRRIDFYDSPDAPRATSVVPSANVVVANDHGEILMIRRSDNAAATAIHNEVGARGLRRLARRAGMKRFIPNPVWGGSQITARDQSRFFWRIRKLVPRRHRSYAMGLLRRIVPGQRWGVPRANPRGWRVHFKGGWTPSGGGWRVNQSALLQKGNRRLAIAVLTDGDPSLGYGATTISGVTRRLLRGYNAEVSGINLVQYAPEPAA